MQLKVYFIIGIISLLSQVILGQQLPLYQFYRDHAGLINPAGVSSNFLAYNMNISGSLTARNQWLKLPESPRTQILSLEYIDDDQFNFSSGLHLVNDQVGAIGQTGIYGNIAYRIPIQNDHILAGGISLGGIQYRLNLGELLSGSDNTNIISTANLNPQQFYYDVGLGLMFCTDPKDDERIFYIGASIPQMFSLNKAFKTPSNTYEIIKEPHYYTNVGYYHFFSKKDFNFMEFNFLGRYLPDSPIGIDANIRYQFNKALWLGLGSGTSKSIKFEAGTMIETTSGNILRLSLGYNQFVSKLNSYFGQTFDIGISYAFYQN